MKIYIKKSSDKGSGFNQSDFKIILDAYKIIYIIMIKKKDYKNSKITKKLNIHNMRKTANFSIYVNDKFDKSRFDPITLTIILIIHHLKLFNY